MRGVFLVRHYMDTQTGMKQSGFSIVELMIAVVIGLIVLAGAIQVVINTKQNRIEQDEVAFIQDNARFAVELISNEIRMAGYMGCASPASAQTANSISDSLGGFIGFGGIEGYDGETSVSGFPTVINTVAKVGTDALIVRRGENRGELSVKSHNTSAATIHLWAQHSYPRGTTLMITDASCRNVGLFQMSAPNSVPADNIVHNTGSVTTNCTKSVKADTSFVCTSACTALKCPTSATVGYGAGSKVMSYSGSAFFIADSALYSGVPVLKRQVVDIAATGGTRSEELALGVEDMELQFGVDTDADNDVNQYRKASQMDVDSNGTINSADWDKVKSVRVSMTFRSQNPVLSANQSRLLNGVTYNDKYLRQAVTFTVAIRNRS